MKICILLRYPKLEKAKWKKSFIDLLVSDGHEISLVFGESSIYRHLKAGLSKYGNKVLEKKKSLSSEVHYESKTLYQIYKRNLLISRVNDLNNIRSENILKKINPDLLILLGTGIIRKNILNIPLKGTIHVHHGNLPTIRGVGTIGWSIFLEKKLYISAHYVNSGIDTGDILGRKKILYDSSDDLMSIKKKCQNETPLFLQSIVSQIDKNTEEFVSQNKNDGQQYYKLHPFFEKFINLKIINN